MRRKDRPRGGLATPPCPPHSSQHLHRRRSGNGAAGRAGASAQAGRRRLELQQALPRRRASGHPPSRPARPSAPGRRPWRKARPSARPGSASAIRPCSECSRISSAVAAARTLTRLSDCRSSSTTLVSSVCSAAEESRWCEWRRSAPPGAGRRLQAAMPTSWSAASRPSSAHVQFGDDGPLYSRIPSTRPRAAARLAEQSSRNSRALSFSAKSPLEPPRRRPPTPPVVLYRQLLELAAVPGENILLVPASFLVELLPVPPRPGAAGSTLPRRRIARSGCRALVRLLHQISIDPARRRASGSPSTTGRRP